MPKNLNSPMDLSVKFPDINKFIKEVAPLIKQVSEVSQTIDGLRRENNSLQEKINTAGDKPISERSASDSENLRNLRSEYPKNEKEMETQLSNFVKPVSEFCASHKINADKLCKLIKDNSTGIDKETEISKPNVESISNNINSKKHEIDSNLSNTKGAQR